MRAYERLIRKIFMKLKKKVPPKQTIRGLAIAATLLTFLLIIILFTSIIVPRIGSSFSMIISNLDNYAKRLAAWLNKVCTTFNIKKSFTTMQIMNFFNSFDLNSLLSTLGNLSGSSSPNMSTMVNSIGSTAVTTVTAFFMSVYLLYSKERHIIQFKKVLAYFFGADHTNQVIDIMNEGTRYFTNFITGQVLEATVFMIEILIMTKLFGFPFGELIASCAFIFSFIPMFGSFLTLAVGTILVAAAKPRSIILFVIMFVITQQFEGNVVYPRIVGKKVGISGLYVLLGITFFGNLWGIFGVLAGVPITALIYATLSRLINMSLKSRGIHVDSTSIHKDV
jgi:predicted PurR-regulated permease PerM